MYTTKATIVVFALVAGAICVQAAGIKGIQSAAGQFRASAVKGPAALRPTFQQQQYVAPAPAPAPVFIPQPAPAPVFVPQPAPAPIFQQQQAVKAGPGSAAPVFSAIRVQPAPAPAPIQQVQQQVQEQEPDSQQQQVQQQAPDQEVDPSAAAQEGAAALLAPARPAAASEEEANPRPEPYAFQYAFNSGDQTTSGSSQREEQQDASGRVTGFYTLKGEDGRDRRVDYVADASGFRATISTNELGTANKDSADVDWTAQEPSEAQQRAAESATQAARQRALLSPAQNQQQFNSQQFSSQQQQQQPQAQAQAQLAFSSSSTSSSQQKFSSPRQRVAAAAAAAASQSQQVSKANKSNNQLQQQVQFTAQQLQEPFEQIRQTELSGRARKSRHAPFYLFTI